MAELQAFRTGDLPALVAVWNRCFADCPNFIELTDNDFLRRVMMAPGFSPDTLLVALVERRIAGFVHYGPRLEMWEEGGPQYTRPEEGHIYALVAPRQERALQRELLEAATQRLRQEGAKQVLLCPSWVYGAQPMYNGLAGAYEIPGLSDTRTELLEVAEEAGFGPLAEYGTPELDLTDEAHWTELEAEAERLWVRAREWGLQEQSRSLRPTFFPNRRAVTLVRGRQVIAMTAYGPWDEYIRQYGRRLFGITSVQVEREWRGRGLGKLIMILAAQAARRAGAEALHLHVYRSNEPAWNLYHRALGFQPRWRWVTLSRD